MSEKKSAAAPAKRFELPTGQIKAGGELTDLVMMIYGPPKIGKTTLANSFPGSVFLPFEPGQNHIDHFQIPSTGIISSWAEMGAACKVLADNPGAFRMPIIDTVELCYETCAEHIAKKRGVEHIGDIGHGKGYALTSNEFMRVIKKLAAMAGGLILISHAKTQTLTKSGVEYEKTTPALSQSAHRTIVGMVDLILFMDTQIVKQGDKDRVVRVVKAAPSARYEAGDRTSRMPRIAIIDKNRPFDSLAYAYKHGKSIPLPKVEEEAELGSESAVKGAKPASKTTGKAAKKTSKKTTGKAASSTEETPADAKKPKGTKDETPDIDF